MVTQTNEIKLWFVYLYVSLYLFSLRSASRSPCVSISLSLSPCVSLSLHVSHSLALYVSVSLSGTASIPDRCSAATGPGWASCDTGTSEEREAACREDDEVNGRRAVLLCVCARVCYFVVVDSVQPFSMLMPYLWESPKVWRWNERWKSCLIDRVKSIWTRRPFSERLQYPTLLSEDPGIKRKSTLLAKTNPWPRQSIPTNWKKS